MLDKDIIQLPGLEEVCRHDHLCLLYEAEEELLTPLALFVQKGLSLGERCVYLHPGEDTLERMLRNLTTGELDSAAVKVLPVQEGWLTGGGFEPARVISVLRGAISRAFEQGFKATRIICDMRWAAAAPGPVPSLPEFEAALDALAAEHETSVLCLYDRKSFAPELLLEIARLHPQLCIGGNLCRNPLYLPLRHGSKGGRARSALDRFLSAAHTAALAAADRDKLRQELEQAYAALARKIYENWQDEDTLRSNEQELHQKDEALVEHRRRLQTILQHLPAMLMAFDQGHFLTSCNHEFERVTGFRAEEVMGREMRELFQLRGELHEELLAAHPEQGGSYRAREWEIRCKDGTTRCASWTNISRYVQIPGWNNWIIGQDISSRVRAESGLRSLSDELEARTGELEAFGLAVSHDLSGQLSKISSHCTTMQELYGVALSPQCRELLKSIHETTAEMVGRINALQRFTSLATDGLQQEEVDLSAMASEIAARLKGSDRRAVTFRIEDGVTATGDRRLLRLAMEQLLENAWNYTVGVQHPVIRFGTAEIDGARSFYVSDNGPRIDAQELLVASRRLDRPGHLCCGIGLATVQRIITLHRGRIWAADEAEKGGTLFFTV